jgi:hypothetical protein
LETSVGQHDNLIEVGAEYAGDIHALCADVSAIIFPSALVPASEATITEVSSRLRQLVSDVEAQLLSADRQAPPKTWKMLARSGFLREPDLVDFTLSRVAEDRLEAQLGDDAMSKARGLLDHPDADVAEAAQSLLAAKSLHRFGAGRTFLALPAEMLHKLCWRVVAASEVIGGVRQPQIVAAARSVIDQYSEANRAQAAAGKIVHLMGVEERRTLLDPKAAGLDTHVAGLSAALGIDYDHVLQLIDAGSSAPYAVALKALDVPKTQAIEAIITLRSDKVTPRDAGIFDAGYDGLDKDIAKAAIDNWAAARASFLAFGRP